MNNSIYCDGGWSSPSSVDSPGATMIAQNCYRVPALKIKTFGVRTDTYSPTATRAPAMINGHAMIENIIEHAAAELGVTPLELKLKNMMTTGDPVMPPNNILGSRFMS